jgi:nicotinamidase-related amidase
MSSSAIRDPLADHLITPQNAALILIDYQPAQFATVRSMDPELLLKNIVSTVKTAKTFGLPIVHSTVNVASGQGKPTVPELAGLLEDSPPIDRTSINSWEDVDFVEAVHATGRRKLIFCALWTEVCMAFAALDALREGYQVYSVVDAIAGTSVEAHRAGLERVVQAGGRPIGWVSLASELQRDWARQETCRTSSRSCSPNAFCRNECIIVQQADMTTAIIGDGTPAAAALDNRDGDGHGRRTSCRRRSGAVTL